MISANLGTGVAINGGGTATKILGNLIGTDESATTALGNGTFGVFLNGSAGIVVGGTVPGSRNIISDNAQAGIGLFGSTTGAIIEDNLIGTDLTGSVALGNGSGIQIDGGSSNNTIGGTAAGAGNTIAFSTGVGVDVDTTAGDGNEIRLNSIFSNTGLGIELGNGVTDTGPQTGPNNYQNFPRDHRALERGWNNDGYRHFHQHGEHNIRDRLLHALIAQRFRLWRGPVCTGLDDTHDRPRRAKPASSSSSPPPPAGRNT